MSALPEDVLSVEVEEIAAAIERETRKGSGRVVLIAPERIEALVAEAEARGAARERVGDGEPATSCAWTEDGEGFWEAACCGNVFAFNDGDPAENRFRFCPYCGKGLAVQADPDPLFYNHDSGETER